MNSLSLLSLTTIIQYSLFGGITLVLFGWFEKKEKLAFAGNLVFVLSGIFAIWLISSSNFDIPKNFTSTIPKELKVLSLLKLTAVLALLNIGSLILGILKNKYYKATLFVISIAALALFFMAFNLLQA